MKDYGFVNDKDGNRYKTVVIGEQTWMAENLNVDVLGGICYGSNPSNCDIYGRLYSWATAMDFKIECDTYRTSHENCNETINSPHQGICPDGWHIPSIANVEALRAYIKLEQGTDNNAGKLLRATSGWDDYRSSASNGTDYYGFSALPGGFYLSSAPDSRMLGMTGYWQSSEEFGTSSGNQNLTWSMSYMNNYISNIGGYTSKKDRHSVRCLKD
jgi:uncharacterized protein (TIGR02145 family)